jgi:hypothetical protein
MVYANRLTAWFYLPFPVFSRFQRAKNRRQHAAIDPLLFQYSTPTAYLFQETAQF